MNEKEQNLKAGDMVSYVGDSGEIYYGRVMKGGSIDKGLQVTLVDHPGKPVLQQGVNTKGKVDVRKDVSKWRKLPNNHYLWLFKYFLEEINDLDIEEYQVTSGGYEEYILEYIAFSEREILTMPIRVTRFILNHIGFQDWHIRQAYGAIIQSSDMTPTVKSSVLQGLQRLLELYEGKEPFLQLVGEDT